MLLQTPWDLDNVDTIIFDEIQLPRRSERGTTWEESHYSLPGPRSTHLPLRDDH